MKPEKAIEVLNAYTKDREILHPKDFDDAIKLGTKALEALKELNNEFETVSK